VAKKKNKKNKKKPRIKDNYSYKEMEMTFKGAKDMQTIHKLARHLGYSDTRLDEAFKNFENAHKQYNII
jgi:hypothetical protein